MRTQLSIVLVLLLILQIVLGQAPDRPTQGNTYDYCPIEGKTGFIAK